MLLYKKWLPVFFSRGKNKKYCNNLLLKNLRIYKSFKYDLKCSRNMLTWSEISFWRKWYKFADIIIELKMYLTVFSIILFPLILHQAHPISGISRKSFCRDRFKNSLKRPFSCSFLKTNPCFYRKKETQFEFLGNKITSQFLPFKKGNNFRNMSDTSKFKFQKSLQLAQNFRFGILFLENSVTLQKKK